ncbi:hypothetical protein [Aliterella atlantica]|uniref:hypothetical protein n=1 Tax=Aliterella atlantica TaxID=1827278 RepID=UPI001364D7AB|nr:hypothetical protein [Aliterella atlantica]
MLYWNLERELVDGEPLFFGQNKQFQHPNPPKSTNNKLYAEVAKVGSAETQPNKI